MLKKYQEHFKENNLKLFLKYDGLRGENIYTIRIFEIVNNNMMQNLGRDTDTPEELLSKILSEVNCDNYQEIYEDIYSFFMRTKSFFVQSLGEKIVLVITFQYVENEAEYTLVVLNDKERTRLEVKANNISDIEKNMNIAEFVEWH